MAENMEVQLSQDERIYYDDKCPGCRIDKLKLLNPGIPFKHLSYVFAVCLVAGLIEWSERWPRGLRNFSTYPILLRIL
ncbi:hypothetical protein TorRG33x02_144540 [Trema orientale]|uniref:Uncharacterized protein n=1 Tax=Trema orientale TaxID=63057 RepID=A0A2P5EW54_TREOI|nr:hypothetical protein TorRG33x02_144540 [Trema orientale]